MKKILFSGICAFALTAVTQPGLAADMPVKAPRPVVEVWSWNGFYIGGNVGYSWGRSRTDVEYFNPVTGAIIVPPAGSITSATFNLNGWLAGGQIGFNRQHNNWVWGLEADLQWTGQRGGEDFLCATTPFIGGVCTPGTTSIPIGFLGTTLSLNQKLEWFGTVRGRIGPLIRPTLLAYVTGGAAFGSLKSTAVLTTATPALALASISSTDRDTNIGWTIGAGIESRLSDNWTGKIEYLYMDFGTFRGSVAFPGPIPPTIGARFESRVTDHILRVGVNYKFGERAIVARN